MLNTGFLLTLFRRRQPEIIKMTNAELRQDLITNRYKFLQNSQVMFHNRRQDSLITFQIH